MLTICGSEKRDGHSTFPLKKSVKTERRFTGRHCTSVQLKIYLNESNFYESIA